MSCINQLSHQAKTSLFTSLFSENYFLWIGSGFSYNFGFASWSDVLDEVRSKLEYPSQIDVTYPLKSAELLYSYAMHEYGYDELKFNTLVSKSLLKLRQADVRPKWVRRFRAFAPNTIVTTNWDNQLERIFDDLVNVIVRRDSAPQVSNKGRNIFKIHGDVGRPNSIVVTQSQYFAFQREDTYLHRKIYTLFSEASPIFFGYSLSDPNISFLYDEVYAHLGEEKPPAYMVVHPTVDDHLLEESRLLFKNKNIHIIRAEIGTFLEDLSHDFRRYKNSTMRFFVEYASIESRLTMLIGHIRNKRPIKKEVVQQTFNNRESRNQAVKAFVEILSNQPLYKEFGGELLAPENRMSYREIDECIQTILWMVNESGYPDSEIKEKFYRTVITLCAKSEGVWNFYSAKRPFTNVLRISPDPDTDVFNDRIKHIVNVLRWSGEGQLGKCWATWEVFCEKGHWLSELDITAILEYLDNIKRITNKKDAAWLQQLKNCKYCTDEHRQTIDTLLAV